MSEQDDIYELMRAEPMVWARHFFTEHFRDYNQRTPPFHIEIIDSAMRYKKLAVASPRGSAKSTILAFVYPAHAIAFKRKRFIVILNNTFGGAARSLETIKMEFRDNQKLREELGHIEITKDALGDSEFKHPDGFITKVLCKGADQLGSLRGAKFGAYRPDLILIDDLEDDELVKSQERRAKLKEDFDLVLDQIGDHQSQYIMIGTILHDDSQMARLVNKTQYTDYHKIIFRGHLHPDTPQESSLWPEKWTIDYLKKLRADKPHIYSKEIQNDPVAAKDTGFFRKDFRYWREENGFALLYDGEDRIFAKYSLRDCRAAIACDLAWEEGKRADFTAVISGFLTPNSEILLYKFLNKRGVRPTELEEYIFELVQSLELITGSSVKVGMEKAKLEKVTQWILREAMKRRNKYLIMQDLAWDGDKIERIDLRLQPRYNQHSIFHQKGMGDLEYQLERFPYGTHDDLIDCEQGLVQLLQYPKTKKVETKESQMDWLLRITRESKMPKSVKMTGSKRRDARWWNTIPSQKSW